MWITVDFRNEYDVFNFIPFIKDMTEAKKLYLQLVWRGCKAVRITSSSWSSKTETVWETPEKVIRSLVNPNPTDDLPF